MALFYTFDLDNGARLHASETSTICLPNGSSKSPDQVFVGETVCHVVGASAVVVSINTVEA